MALPYIEELNPNQFACFVGCTLVRMATDVYPFWKRIDEVQVGDMVLAVPEDGIGEAVPKRVLNTFKYEL